MQTYIDRASSGYEILPTLPLFHTMTLATFLTTLETNTLSTKLCNNLNKNLLYFFYGRAAYRYDMEKEIINMRGRGIDEDLAMPVCIAIEPIESSTAANIYPFDTGGFSLYSHHIQRNEWSRYQLSNVLTVSPKKFIRAFFDDNIKYHRGKTRTAPDPSETLAHAYYVGTNDSEHRAHMRRNGSTVFDDRQYTIEVQLQSDLNLSEVKVSAVILSDEVATQHSKRVRKTWNGAKILTYQTFTHFDYAFHYGQIATKAFSYLVRPRSKKSNQTTNDS